MRKISQLTPKPDKSIHPRCAAWLSHPDQKPYWAGQRVKQQRFDAQSATLVRYIGGKLRLF